MRSLPRAARVARGHPRVVVALVELKALLTQREGGFATDGRAGFFFSNH